MENKPPSSTNMLYWKSSPFGLAPEAQIYPAGSNQPIGSYLAKYELTKEDMKKTLDELMKKYPLP